MRVASCWKVFRFHTMSLPSSPMLHKVWSCTWTWNDQLLSTSMGRGITPSHVCITNENKNKRIVYIYIYSYCHHTIAYSPYLLFLATIASLQQLRTNRDRLQPTSTVSSGSKLILSTSRLCPCRVVTWRSDTPGQVMKADFSLNFNHGLQAPTNGSCAVFLLQVSLGKHIKHILHICIGKKKTCTNTWAYQRCLAAYFSISHLRWMPWHLRRSLQKTSETFEFSKRPHLRQSSDTEDMDHLSLGRR